MALMEYRALGTSTLQVSAIGLGCVTFGREIDRPASFAILDRAIERGITLLDTAANYGDGASETVLGSWLRDRGLRKHIILATKVAPPLTQANISATAEASLRRLGCETVDLLQVHSWDAGTPLEETLDALDTLVRQGKTRFLGCSNFSCAQFSAALERQRSRHVSAFVSSQSIYNLVHREIEQDLLPFCQAQGLGMITYSPLGAGFLTGKHKRGNSAPAGSRFDVKPGHTRIYYTEEGFATVEALAALAARLNHSMVQLALHWVLTRPEPTSVLVGARDPAQVDQAFAARELTLDPEWTRELPGCSRA